MTHSRKLATLTTALMLTAWTAGPSLAADQGTAAPKPTQTRQGKHSALRTIYGTLSAVAPDAKTVEVTVPRGKGDSLVVGAKVTNRTVIKEGKTRRDLADLKVGDHVWMKFERASSGDIAKIIVVKPEKKRS